MKFEDCGRLVLGPLAGSMSRCAIVGILTSDWCSFDQLWQLSWLNPICFPSCWTVPTQAIDLGVWPILRFSKPKGHLTVGSALKPKRLHCRNPGVFVHKLTGIVAVVEGLSHEAVKGCWPISWHCWLHTGGRALQ